jgi:hypothetical protein
MGPVGQIRGGDQTERHPRTTAGRPRRCAASGSAGCTEGPVRRPNGPRHVGWWQPSSVGPSATACIVTAEEVIGIASDRDYQAASLHRQRWPYARIAEHLGYPDRRAAYRGVLRSLAEPAAEAAMLRSMRLHETDDQLLDLQWAQST